MANFQEFSLESIVLRVVAAVDAFTPTVLTEGALGNQTGQILALAALQRMADLLQSELELFRAGKISTTRSLARTITDLWLNGNQLLLDPEVAVERLLAEDTIVNNQLQHGANVLWQRYEKHREDGVDARNPEFERESGQRPNLENLSMTVAKLRKQRGLGDRGLAEYNYQWTYRRDSSQDVHATLEHLFRYVRPDNGVIQILRTPDPDDVSVFRGPEAIRQDAQLISDLLGIYLRVSGQDAAFDRLVVFLNSPLG